MLPTEPARHQGKQEVFYPNEVLGRADPATPQLASYRIPNPHDAAHQVIDVNMINCHARPTHSFSVDEALVAAVYFWM